MIALADFRTSARSLARTPGLTLALVLTIAVGVGSTAAIQGFVHGLATANTPRASSTTLEVAAGMSRVSGLLGWTSATVLLVAAGNVALLLFARASARSRETSIRVALGSSHAQLARQLLADSIVLSLTGAACGAIAARWTAQVIPALFFDQDAQQLAFAPDVTRIAVVSAIGAAVIVLCGLVPLVEAQRQPPASALQRDVAGPSPGVRRVRHAIVIAQLAACWVLAMSSWLLTKGLPVAMQTAAGRRVERTLIVPLEAPAPGRPDRGLTYFHDAEVAARSLSGIGTTAWVGRPPGSRPAWQAMRVEPPELPRREVEMELAAYATDAPGFIPDRPTAGRMFSGADTPESCRVVIVNRTAANAMFGGDAVGRAIEDSAGQRAEIVGVIAPAASTPGADVHPTVYSYPIQTPPFGLVGRSRFVVPELPTVVTATLDTHVVSAASFALAGLTLKDGAIFEDARPARGCRVAVVNEEASERYFGGHAVGGAVIDDDGRRTGIVGVVRSSLLHVLQRPTEPAIYLPMTQDYLRRMTLLVATSGDEAAMVSPVRDRLTAATGSSGIEVTTLTAYLGRVALAPERLATTLVATLAVLALLLGTIGVQSALAESARQRRRDLALRMALGAQGRTLVRQLVGEGLRLAAAGALLGTIGSMLAARWLARIAPGAGLPTLWMSLGAAAIVLAAVGLATIVPARLVLTVDPLTIARR